MTSSELKDLFDYDRSTGNLIWKPRSRDQFRSNGAFRRWNVMYPGRIAGSKQYQPRDGVTPSCVRVNIGGKRHQAHHIIWEMNNTPIPAGHIIDHKDRNPFNNRLDNLRLATCSENNCNTGKLKNNTSGFKGVSWHKRSRKWYAYIRIDGRLLHLGAYDDVEIAASKYREAAYHYFGEFANVA